MGEERLESDKIGKLDLQEWSIHHIRTVEDCRAKFLPLVVWFAYDCSEIEGYLGNVDMVDGRQSSELRKLNMERWLAVMPALMWLAR